MDDSKRQGLTVEKILVQKIVMAKSPERDFATHDAMVAHPNKMPETNVVMEHY